MHFIARHIPSLATALSLFLCATLITLGYQTKFKQKLAESPPSIQTNSLSHLVIAYHNRPGHQGLLMPLSKALAPHNPIRRLVYMALLAFTNKETQIAAYLYHTHFGNVRGFKHASQYYFGIHHTKLTTGEILLLCDLANGSNLPINDPIATLNRRDTLLTDLYNRGLLPSTRYHAERNKALSLSADHRPVN